MRRVDKLLRTLSGEAFETPVWTADISYWASANADADPRARAAQNEEGYLGLCDELRCMPYYWYPAFWAHRRVFAEGASVVSESDGIRTTRWTAAGRSIEQVERYSETSSSQAVVKYAVETVEDLGTLVALIEASRLEVTEALSGYARRLETWEKHDGLPSLGLPRSPLSAFINEWAGVRNGTLLLFDEPDLCGELFELLERQERPILERCAADSIPLVHFPDNLTSEVYTSLFDSHMRGFYERRLDLLHRTGVRTAVHLDGTVGGLLPKLIEIGFDAVEAVTPAPVGDLTAASMRDLARSGSTVLWGGVPGAMFAPPYTWRQMERHIRRLLDAWRGIPFVLGVADQVPPDGDIETVRRIAESTAPE